MSNLDRAMRFGRTGVPTSTGVRVTILTGSVAWVALGFLGGCSQTPDRQEIRSDWDRQRASLKYELASSELRRGRTDSALQLAHEALGLSPSDARHLELLARTYLSRADFPSARSLLEPARTLHPRDAGIAYLLGTVYERERNWRQAMIAYGDAARMDPSRLEHCIALAQACAQSGDAERAEQTLLAGEARFRDQPAWHIARAELALREGRLAEAAEAFRDAQRLGHESREIRAALGLSLYWLGSYEEALAQLEPLARSMTQDGGAEGASASSPGVGMPGGFGQEALIGAYAGSLIAVGDAQRADEMLTRATRTQLGDAGLWTLLAAARLEADRPGAAADAARFATRIDPRRVEAWCVLVVALRADDRPHEAREALRAAERLAPGDPDVVMLSEMLSSEAGGAAGAG
ncbi:MAG: tetratricopeptide repeat protein [Planctomycetia bacterium]|nr:MAG: tetratricopeptide repeat protein [Planctomycetia bacterium]